VVCVIGGFLTAWKREIKFVFAWMLLSHHSSTDIVAYGCVSNNKTFKSGCLSNNDWFWNGIELTLREDIPILIERKEEDVESLIDRTFQNLQQKENFQKSTESSFSNIRAFIQNTAQEHIKTKSKRENYYEAELYHSLKSRISFLEEEVRNILLWTDGLWPPW